MTTKSSEENSNPLEGCEEDKLNLYLQTIGLADLFKSKSDAINFLKANAHNDYEISTDKNVVKVFLGTRVEFYRGVYTHHGRLYLLKYLHYVSRFDCSY